MVKKSKKSGGNVTKKELLQALKRHIRARGADYLADPNITSVGVGLKNGKGPICLQFTVATKGASALESVGLGTRLIDPEILVEGISVPTDVLQRNFDKSYTLVAAEEMNNHRARMDPIQPGISVSEIHGTAGTIGLIVYDRATGAPCILSNWHVLHGNSGGMGGSIVQPGPFDDNNSEANVCATLLRSHLGAAGDCALGKIQDRGFSHQPLGFEAIPAKMAEVEIGDTVVKSGRTTEITHGLVRRINVMVKINYGHPTGTKAIGCFEIGEDPKRPATANEISMGGDSGSAWLISKNGAATDIFAGLHFAGETQSSDDEHALACYPKSVQKKLDFQLTAPSIAAFADERAAAQIPRAGYDAHFLGHPVPMPKMSLSIKRDAVNFGRAQTIPYTHFSVCLSARRRLPRFVAWNIDGEKRVVLPRRTFKLDPRIDSRHQFGNELYRRNPLDRGHIARRADLNWGPVREAEQANRDSFFYTNIAPQHESFNQSSRRGLWGQLENTVLEQLEDQDIKASVMGGPIFGKNDTEYRGTKIPREFWKLIAYLGRDGELRVSVFMLSQADLVRDLEVLDFDPFRIFQISVADLSDRTRLNFSALSKADVTRFRETLARRPESGPEWSQTEVKTEAALIL